MKLGGQKGELSHATTPHQLQSPIGRIFLTQQPAQPMGSAHQPELSFSPNKTFLKLTPHNSLLLLYKVIFLSFVRLAYDFCYSFLAPNCNFSTILEKKKTFFLLAI